MKGKVCGHAEKETVDSGDFSNCLICGLYQPYGQHYQTIRDPGKEFYCEVPIGENLDKLLETPEN